MGETFYNGLNMFAENHLKIYVNVRRTKTVHIGCGGGICVFSFIEPIFIPHPNYRGFFRN